MFKVLQELAFYSHTTFKAHLWDSWDNIFLRASGCWQQFYGLRFQAGVPEARWTWDIENVIATAYPTIENVVATQHLTIENVIIIYDYRERDHFDYDYRERDA